MKFPARGTETREGTIVRLSFDSPFEDSIYGPGKLEEALTDRGRMWRTSCMWLTCLALTLLGPMGIVKAPVLLLI